MHHIKIDSKLLDSACMERTTKSRSRMLQTNTHRSSPSSRKEGRGIGAVTVRFPSCNRSDNVKRLSLRRLGSRRHEWDTSVAAANQARQPEHAQWSSPQCKP